MALDADVERRSTSSAPTPVSVTTDIETAVGTKVGVAADAMATVVSGVDEVSTGADANGTPRPSTAIVIGATGTDWTRAATALDCGRTARLICFEK